MRNQRALRSVKCDSTPQGPGPLSLIPNGALINPRGLTARVRYPLRLDGTSNGEDFVTIVSKTNFTNRGVRNH